MEEEEDRPDIILLVSEQQRQEDMSDTSIKKSFKFMPVGPYEWSFLYLQLFLNSLTDFKRIDKCRLLKSSDDSYFYIKFTHAEKKEYFVRISYFISTCKIEVSGSTQWMIDKWKKQIYTSSTLKGTQNRTLKSRAMHSLGAFYYVILTDNEGCSAIIDKKHPIFYDIDSFSEPYQEFVQHFVKNVKLEDTTKDIWFLIEFYNTWFDKTSKDSRRTEQKFFEDNEGYIKFLISEKKRTDEAKTIIKDDGEFSILSGIYISPFAKSIFSDLNCHLVDGLLMDTTWKAMPYYVTSILMASICNVGVPAYISNSTLILKMLLMST